MRRAVAGGAQAAAKKMAAKEAVGIGDSESAPLKSSSAPHLLSRATRGSGTCTAGPSAARRAASSSRAASARHSRKRPHKT